MYDVLWDEEHKRMVPGEDEYTPSSLSSFVFCNPTMGRTFTEEHARDSFENLLFGLCRFYELTGHYPDQLTVVSYTLKQNRFSTLHRGALRFPQERFTFLGTPVSTSVQIGLLLLCGLWEECVLCIR